MRIWNQSWISQSQCKCNSKSSLKILKLSKLDHCFFLYCLEKCNDPICKTHSSRYSESDFSLWCFSKHSQVRRSSIPGSSPMSNLMLDVFFSSLSLEDNFLYERKTLDTTFPYCMHFAFFTPFCASQVGSMGEKAN